MVAMTELEQGVELWDLIATQLNDIIKLDGELHIDDARIWDQYLHKWHNEDWMLLVQAAYKLFEQHPDLFKPFHKAALEDAILALSMSKGNTRVLDTKKNKGVEWKMIMMLREVWNAAQGVYIPNQPQKSNVVNIKPTTTYNNLFNNDNKNTGTDDDI
jgi:hypothetical protein